MDPIYKTLDVFTDYSFDEKFHKYTWNGQEVNTSVTQLIDKYSVKFDSDYWATKKAKDRNVEKEVILKEWEYKGTFAANCGTQFHAYMENKISGKHYNPYVLSEEGNARVKVLCEIGDNFLSQCKHKLIPIKSEVIVGIENKIAGQVDQLFYNTASEEFEIWDWKTNKDISTHAFKGQRMFPPFTVMEDCAYSHYSLQLQIYKFILQKYGARIGNCYFVHFSDSKKEYFIHKASDLQSYCKEILDF